MAPMTAFQILQGLETLPVRMERHIANTAKIVEYLAGNEAVVHVNHPGLAAHPDHALAARLYPRGSSAILSFELKGGRDAGRKFIERLTLFSHLATSATRNRWSSIPRPPRTSAWTTRRSPRPASPRGPCGYRSASSTPMTS
jgi:O-acetylhomoserine/O-acetylserine sulfhydrylase-like pyridoxal-dependent enzyme